MELETFHPNLAQNIALNNGKTRAAEQEYKRAKENPRNLRAQPAVANFLPSWITASERSAGLLQNIRTASLVHTDSGERTQHTRAHTHTQQLSVTQLSLLGYSKRAAAQSNFKKIEKNLLV